jgi:methylphosphotriester-DNA--protein-cysteine methyltransferase
MNIKPGMATHTGIKAGEPDWASAFGMTPENYATAMANPGMSAGLKQAKAQIIEAAHQSGCQSDLAQFC